LKSYNVLLDLSFLSLDSVGGRLSFTPSKKF
jgi:hypothetical protein